MAGSAKQTKSGSRKTAAKGNTGRTSQKKTAGSKKRPAASGSGRSTGRSRSTSGAGRASASGARRNSGGRKQSANVDFPWKREILLFVILGISILIFISMIGFGGMMGAAFRTFFFGLFGMIAYVFPFWLFFFSVFLAANTYRGSDQYGRTVMKVIAVLLLLTGLCMFLHLVCYLDHAQTPGEVYLAGAQKNNGGGAYGAFFAIALVRAAGIAGAFVVTIILLAVSVVLISEHSFLIALSKKLENPQRAELRRLRKEEAAQRREMEREREAAALRESIRRRQEREAALIEESSGQPVQPKRKRSPRTEDEDNRAPVRRAGQAAAGKRKKRNASAEDAGNVRNGDRNAVREVHLINLDTNEEETITLWKDGIEPAIHMPDEVRAGEDMPWDTDRAVPDGEAAQPDGSDPADVRPADAQTEVQMPDAGKQKPEESETDGKAAGIMEEEADQTRSEKSRRSAKRNPVSGEEENEAVRQVIESAKAAPKKKKYIFPKTTLLKKQDSGAAGDSRKHLQEMSRRLQMTLTNFGVDAHVTDVTCGPSVTRYEIQPEMGVKVSKIVNLADDIKLNLAVTDIRIEAPVPGKSVVGIEVPNKETVTVSFRSLIESPEFKKESSRLSFCAGKDIAGKTIIANIAKMPHVLIAGATGSGKSVCINTIIMSILFKASPEEVKMIMIDPKVVELSVYNGIPHLLLPVVTDPKKAAGALNWAVSEMTDRYQKFAEYHVRDITAYNEKVDQVARSMTEEEGEKPVRMPQILIIVDELADLMMAAPGDVEGAICRLAQLARACGIHLVIATQRPSVNVITGLIKANMPSRIAFAVSSGVDSRTILDMNGAEKLLGKGDMLFYPQNFQKPLRVQGAFVSDEEVASVVSYLIEKNGDTPYDPSLEKTIHESAASASVGGGVSGENDVDVYFEEAGRFLIEKEKGSIGMLQRMFKVGFNRAARIMDQLESAGVVGPEEGTKPRRILMTMEEFDAYLHR